MSPCERLSVQDLPLIGPLKRFGQSIVGVFDELEKALAQILLRREVSAFEQAAHQNTKPDFDLIEPGSVSRGVRETDAVARVFQEGSACSQGLQDARTTFCPQVIGDVQLLGHVADQPFGLMDVQLVRDEDPGAVGIILYGLGNVIDEILLISGVLYRGKQHSSSCDLKIRNQDQRPMASVVVLLAFNQSRLHSQSRCVALQGLHARLLVDREEVDAQFVQFLPLNDGEDMLLLEIQKTLK